ncbi:MAG: DUF6591 domain-containing protein [Bacillota bacterium]|jgi:hypothetical protein
MNKSLKTLLSIILLSGFVLLVTGCDGEDIPTSVAEPTEILQEETTSTEIAGTESIEKSQTNDDTISPEFKSTMDSYEAFFDEYVAFMKKYASSDGTDLSLLTDYSEYLTKYTDVMNKLSAMEEDELTTAEALYLLDAQTRITQKLAQIDY